MSRSTALPALPCILDFRCQIDLLSQLFREVFVNRFSHMFLSFEHFVIINTEEDLALMSPQLQDSMQNFDKISFLSDQVRTLKGFSNCRIE